MEKNALDSLKSVGEGGRVGCASFFGWAAWM